MKRAGNDGVEPCPGCGEKKSLSNAPDLRCAGCEGHLILPAAASIYFGDLSDPLIREAAPDQDLHRLVLDRYRVDRVLGQGGMASVYLALDTKLNRPVALKELKQEMRSEDFVRRFVHAQRGVNEMLGGGG